MLASTFYPNPTNFETILAMMQSVHAPVDPKEDLNFLKELLNKVYTLGISFL